MAKSIKVKRFTVERKGFFIDCRVGQREVGDLIGLPALVDTVASLSALSPEEILLQKRFVHILPDLLRPAFVKNLSDLPGTIGDENDPLADMRPAEDFGKPYECIVLFFDELNRGTKDTTQAVFQVVLDREMNGVRLHDACWVFSAINDNTERYVVGELGPALLSRFHLIPFEPTHKEWLDWGRKSGELHESVLFLLESQKNLIDPDDDADLTKPHQNRRGWHMFSLYLKDWFETKELDFLRTVCSGYVGAAAAEMWKGSTEDMKQTMEKRRRATATANDKVGKVIANYFRYRNWKPGDLKKAVDDMNVNELNELVDRSVEYFSSFTFLSTPVQDLLEGAVGVLPNEMMAKLWNELNPQLKPKIKQRNRKLWDKFENLPKP